MKLFDFLTDVVAIAAVLTLVSVMTADDAPAMTSTPDATPSSLAATSPAAVGPDGRQMTSPAAATLDRLEAELRAQLAAPVPEIEIPDDGNSPVWTASDSAASETLSAAKPIIEVPIARGVPTVPETPGLVPSAAVDLFEMSPSPTSRRVGGAPPSASGPLRPMDMLPPPPMDETDLDLQPFGASLGLPGRDLATAPRVPRRVR